MSKYMCKTTYAITKMSNGINYLKNKFLNRISMIFNIFLKFSGFLIIFLSNFVYTKSKTSYIEIDIYNSLINESESESKSKNQINYTYQILDRVDGIYQNLDITFFVHKEEYFQIKNQSINNLLSNTQNQADVTLILVNLPTEEKVRGISYVNTICSEYAVMVANTYNIPENFVPYIIAHELGHIFGAHHSTALDNSQDNIMNSVIIKDNFYFFTEKSKNEMNFEARCLHNIPQNYIYMSQEKLLNSSQKYNYKIIFHFFILCLHFHNNILLE